MLFIDKNPNKDFVILNIADPQLSRGQDNLSDPFCQIMVNTVKKCIEVAKPDFITCTGDFGYGYFEETFDFYGKFFGELGIPWSFVWGNHDNQCEPDARLRIRDRLLSSGNCLFEDGPAELGNGNYTVCVREVDKNILGMIFMDSHDRVSVAQWENCYWAKLYPEQLEWYANEVKKLREIGCEESMGICHNPLVAYQKVAKLAYREYTTSHSVAQSYTNEIWNEGFEGAFGPRFEEVSCCRIEDDAMEFIEKLGHTKNWLAGHDHSNAFSIPYHGIRYTFGLKAGNGCYYDNRLNGCTVYTVGNDGVKDVRHIHIEKENFNVVDPMTITEVR